MDHWTSLAHQLIGKHSSTDDMEIAVQAISELARQCADMKSWLKHLEQKVTELERRR